MRPVANSQAQTYVSKRDMLWVRFLSQKEMKYLIFSFLRIGGGKTMPPEFDGKWGAEYLNTSLPLSTLLQREAENYVHIDLYLLYKLHREQNDIRLN